MIDHDEASLCVEILRGGTTYGWSDDATATYVRALAMYDDAHLLAEVCAGLVRIWMKPEKPPLGIIKQAYDSEIRRREMAPPDQPALPPPEEHYPTYEEGVEIARRAYHDECYRQGRKPNDELFESFLGAGREERKARENWRQPRSERFRH